jgi:dimethylhistidine N-methyltransferase
MVASQKGGTARAFADDLRRTLARRPRQIPCRYLYDALGSHLFEAICELPWYRITRAESELLRAHGDAMVASPSDPVTLVELGCGSGEKIGVLVGAITARGARAVVHLVDVSQTALDLSERSLARFPGVAVNSHQATYEAGLAEVARAAPAGGHTIALFLGSNIGNSTNAEAAALLRRVRAALTPGDALLLGADLVKPERDLVLAYDDPLGVTAAFNKNLLLRINRELGGDFDLAGFDHEAVWNAEHARMDMFLVSRRAQRVRVDAAELDVTFAAGERIWTESSYKYTPEAIAALGEGAGFRVETQWLEPDARFAVTRLAAM